MIGMLRAFKRKLFQGWQSAKDAVRFLRQYRAYLNGGWKPTHSEDLMRQAYLFTNGRSNDLAAWYARRRFPPVAVSDRPGFWGPLSPREIQNAVDDLQREGVHVFPHRLPPENCARLLEFATACPCAPRADYLRGTAAEKAPFNSAAVAQAPTYWFDRQELADSPVVQRAFLDPSFWRVAQAYLGVEPILDLYAMWWSVPYGTRADDESAQMFHFDMDRVKWLKFFIYLTDVGPDNGPHVFLRGTHRRASRGLRRHGVRRIPDDEAFRHWPRERAVELTGPAGTVFAEDTRGFHKGKPVRSGARLVFELEFATDLYGVDYLAPLITDRSSAEFLDAVREHPRIFSAFKQQEHHGRILSEN
jgi:hypothetical protein